MTFPQETFSSQVSWSFGGLAGEINFFFEQTIYFFSFYNWPVNFVVEAGDHHYWTNSECQSGMEEIAECVPSDVRWVQAHLGDVILHLLSFIVICHLQNERNVIGKLLRNKRLFKCSFWQNFNCEKSVEKLEKTSFVNFLQVKRNRFVFYNLDTL